MKYICITVLVVLLLSLDAKATIVYVDSAHLGGVQTGTSWSSAFANLQSGINAAQPGDSVWVAKGTYRPVGSFSMKEGVKILGGFSNTHTSIATRNWQLYPTILRPYPNSNMSVVLNFLNQLTPSALLDGFTITNGWAVGGGGMENVGSSPTIANCIITNNTSLVADGGGVVNRNARPVFINCTFSNNTGHGIYHNSTNSASSAELIISGCTFMGNSLMGILSDESSDTLKISNSIFNSNNGGVTANSGLASLFIDSCTFTNHQYGGAVVTLSGNSTAPNSSAYFNNCTFSENQGINWGATFINNGTASFTDCNFTNNTASGGAAGVQLIYSLNIAFLRCHFADNTGHDAGGMAASSGSLSVKHCTFTNNTGNDVGGMAAGSWVSSFTIDSSTFNGNSGYYGGGLYNNANAALITNNTFIGNNGWGGGGLYNYSDSTIIRKCIFQENLTTRFNGYGGEGGGIFNKCRNVLVDSCSFVGNSCLNGGAAIYNLFIADTVQANINNCSFKNNNAFYSLGGAIFNNGGVGLRMANSRFNNNMAGSGGCIYNYNSSSQITNSLFAKNKAATAGGVIYNTNGWSEMSNCTVVQNESPVGSSIYNLGSNTIMNNSILWGNSNVSSIFNDANSSNFASYSLIQDLPANSALHLLDGATDPLFTDTSGIGDYYLQGLSACLNRGNNDSIWTGVMSDLQGNTRIMGDVVDMGAYEYLLLPSYSLGNDTMMCMHEDDSLHIHAHNTGASYVWNTGAVTQSIAVTNSGTYSVMITNSAGITYDTIVVTINPNPVVQLGNDTAIAPGATLLLDAGNAGSSFLWNTGETSATINVVNADTFSVQVTNNSGCMGSDTIVINMGLNLQEEKINAAQWSVSPNPATASIILKTDFQLLNTTAIITDFSGRIMKSFVIKHPVQEESFADIPSGIYVMKMQNGTTTKIVKR